MRYISNNTMFIFSLIYHQRENDFAFFAWQEVITKWSFFKSFSVKKIFYLCNNLS